jgi:hypothetical protein
VLGVLVVSLLPFDLLLPKVPLSGVVRDAVTSEPIGGAKVKVGPHATTTDVGGAFSADRVSLTDTVQVEAEGYKTGQTGVWPPRQQDVKLQPRTFAVSVRDAETGQPIADAAAVSPGIRVNTLEPGRFEVAPARQGGSLTVSAPGYRNADVRYRGEGEIALALQPRLGGSVVDGTTGQPIPGAFLAQGDLAVTADDNGSFELDRRPDGPLRVMAAGYRRAEIDASQERTLVARLDPMSVRAVYLTYYGVGDRGLRQNVLSLVDRTDVNAVVIDVKGDRGKLTYKSAVPLAERIGANAEPTVPNMDELMAALKQRGVYTIARIVVFKDDVLARNGKAAGLDVAVKGGLGDTVWTDGEGLGWVDPLRPEVWQYNIDLAREAASKGFDEVQFDYARFPIDSAGSFSASQARYSRPWITERDRVEAVGGFLRRARDELHPLGAFVSADVFGSSAWNDGDNGVGHDLDALAGSVDYLCPTVFPSSFRAGLPGLVPYPQVIQQPYVVVFESLRRARARVDNTGTVLRPWLQYFDDYAWQTGRVYKSTDVDAQRNGAAAAGVSGWMMWDPLNKYTRGGFGPHP